MKSSLHNLFKTASATFFVEELENIMNDVNERNLCGRLAIYLNEETREQKLDGYFVDPEYNRKQDGKVKTILDDNCEVVNINCDIILHSRGKIVAHDNLIAVEMKKSNRPEVDKNSDRMRLRALTKESYDNIWSADGVTLPEHVCGYYLGYYMEINIRTRKCLFEIYQKGQKVSKWIQDF
jgi:16S rRNA G966 N2-methylase RsmD